jgi:hypothetical protein
MTSLFAMHAYQLEAIGIPKDGAASFNPGEDSVAARRPALRN